MASCATVMLVALSHSTHGFVLLSARLLSPCSILHCSIVTWTVGNQKNHRMGGSNNAVGEHPASITGKRAHTWLPSVSLGSA